MKIVKTISFFCFFAFLAVACNNKMEDEFTSVTREELLTLFNFDTQKDVYENIQSLNSFNKNKQYRVNGKSITINKLIPEEMDAELGTFILAVEGTVNGTPFSERLEFKGFNPPKTEKGEEDINEEEHEKEEEKEEDYTVSEEEIISLFILDRNGTVDNAIAELEQFKGHKHINGKEITIDAIEVIRQDNKTGDFTLLVKGNADGKKDFELTLDFTGFAPCEEEVVANKPSDYNMAERAYVQIAEGKNIYDANFDGFYRENKKDEFALQLKDFLTISSSGTDGIPYLYDQEDLRHTSLTVIGYDKWEKELSLTVTYKEYTSQELSIPFDHNEYYKTFVSVNTEELQKIKSVGPSLPAVSVIVLDDDGKELPRNQEGELCIKGPNVFRGYFNNPKATQDAFTQDGWFKTGDIGVIDDDGFIFIKDRKKDMIIIKGLKVFSAQVEAVICEHPAIEECAIIGVPDGRGGEFVKCYAVKKEGAELSDNDFRKFLKQHLDTYKRPRDFEFVDELPKNALKKVLKRELRKDAVAKLAERQVKTEETL